MKKIIIFSIIILLIPFLIVTIFIKEEKKQSIGLEIKNDTIIKVKREDNSIETVPFEDYIIGVLAAEMPANFEIEALKAQAVAARSYVLNKIEQNKNEDYDILDSVMNQVYINNDQMKEKWQNNYEEYLKKIKKAVNDTKGEYLTYDGKVIEAFFFAISNGKTENVEDVFSENLPYLRSVDSTWDKDFKAFNATTTFTLDEFYFNLGLEYNKNLNIEILEKNDTGSIKRLKVNGKEFKGTDFRIKLKIRSTYFTIEQKENKVIINTNGYGHGVGMSQYGAQAMALKGYKYDEILKYYYQGVEIFKI